MGFFDRISSGLHRSRDKFKEQMNILLDRGPDVDEEFWETLEEALILSDFGAAAVSYTHLDARSQAITIASEQEIVRISQQLSLIHI